MKTAFVLGAVVLVSAAVAFAQRRASDSRSSKAAEPATTARPSVPPDETNTTLSGEIREVIDVAEYTYVRLATQGGDTWAAVRTAPVRVGQKIGITAATRMEAFESRTLGRTFDVIYFGELTGASARGESGMPPGHPPIADGMAARPSGHGASPATASVTSAQKIARASGGNAKTVAELYAERATLAGKRWRVQGEVVKATPGVMGKNYYRLRDGSSSDPGRSDLVVTTQATPKIGGVVTFEGTLRLDVDVGIGFVYPVLLEDAELLAAP